MCAVHNSQRREKKVQNPPQLPFQFNNLSGYYELNGSNEELKGKGGQVQTTSNFAIFPQSGANT